MEDRNGNRSEQIQMDKGTGKLRHPRRSHRDHNKATHGPVAEDYFRWRQRKSISALS